METDHIIAIVVCIIALLVIILYTVAEPLIGNECNICRIFYCPVIIVFTIAYICPHNPLNILSIAVSIFLILPVAVLGKRMDRYQP
ncbi:MAG: hypothetical protein JWL92_554 [Candidatus Nomurabacteria bacterium]|nr:hypothetical protein [Candidatus Nomurabacteria bacterium]